MNIRTLRVADIEIPPSLEPLRELAYDLWWSWSPLATRLFSWIDPDHWKRYHDPVQLLINVEPQTWARLWSDSDFVRTYDTVLRLWREYHASPRWFDEHKDKLAGPVAYFSMEFGIHESIGVYSGGLGVLAGDHCKAASDLGVPLVGVGLLYQSGYFRQTVDADGFQQHFYPRYDFARLPVQPVQAPAGGVLTVPIDLPGRVIQAAVWKAQVGRVPVLMLDTDIHLNDPADRLITSLLYVRGREMRLSQEIVLGIGGVRALRALDIHPTVWHMNEGHVAFLGLERAREKVGRGDSLGDALLSVARNTVFTTHTPVPAGNEVFDRELVKKYLEPWVREVGCEPANVLDLGAEKPGGNLNLTVLGIRLSKSVNGVSRLHGDVSSNMWRHLFPGNPERPIGSVTNGVHTQSWIGPEMAALYGQHLGADWDRHLLDADYWKKAHDIPDDALWSARRAQKERLVRFLRERVRNQSARHGVAPDELRLVEGLLDPQALTIGFARRFATYKRAVLVLSDLERLGRILGNAKRPVQIIFAGKAHPADRAGQDMIRRLFLLTQSEFRGRVAFLEDYDIHMGRMLVQGCDLWLNTPRRPQEASGTSGMKSPVNGGINVSILDGWWCEGYNGENGWTIGTADPPADPDAQDREDAASLYQVLEDEIVPMYFDRDGAGPPLRWIERMKTSIASVVPQFSAQRMVRDYVLEAYVTPTSS